MLNMFIANYGIAQDTYIVKRGDTLSHIIKTRFPNDTLYGHKGKLAEVLEQNPHIKTPDLIYRNQRIAFTRSVIKPAIPVATDNFPSLLPEIRKLTHPIQKDEWNIAALYGAKYVSVSQSGALGKADVGVLFLNDLKLHSEFVFDNWAFGFQIDSYTFKYQTLTSNDSKKMYSLDLLSSYKGFVAGLAIEQIPLFRNNAGLIDMNKQTLMFLVLGAQKDIELSTAKPTALKFKTWFKLPVSSSTDNAQVEVKSVTGIGVRGQVELNRQIFAKLNYSLHATWMAQLGYQKVSERVEWDTSAGKVESNLIDSSTALGLLIKF